MSCAVEVTGEGPDLVLLHGWGMNNGVWHPVMPLLAEHFRVTAIELPGHGVSDELDHAVDWAEAVLQSAPQRAIWMGWSLGAQLAAKAALIAPGRVSGLLMLGGTPKFVATDDWPHAMDPQVFHQFAEALVANVELTLQRFLSLQVKGSDDSRETLRQLKLALAERPSASEWGLRRGLELLLENDLRHDIHDLDCASVWVFGQRDTLVPAAAAQDIEQHLSWALCHVIPGAGHAPFLSHQTECLRVLNDFVAGCHVD